WACTRGARSPSPRACRGSDRPPAAPSARSGGRSGWSRASPLSSSLRWRSLVSFARAHQYSSLALISILSILRSRSCSSRSLARRRRGAGGGARRGARGARGGRGDTLHPALAVARVTVEGARGRELTELVANRVLRDEDGDELPPVVHREGEAHHVGRDGRAARPGLHHLLLARLEHGAHLLHEMRVDERALLYRACHGLAHLPSLHDPALGALVVPGLVALGRLAPGRLRVVALRAPLAAAVRMVDRVHRHSAHLRAPAEP